MRSMSPSLRALIEWCVLAVGASVFLWYLVFAQKRTRLHNEKRARERRDALVLKYGAEVADQIIRGAIWDGETEEQLRESLGEPHVKDFARIENGKREVWKYNHVAAGKFRLRVTVENGIVVAWEGQ